MIKRATILLLCAMLTFPFFPPPLPVQAAIAQTATGTQAWSNADPVTMQFDCNGGDFFVLSLPQQSAYADGRLRAGGSPTYNSVAMTQVGASVSSGSETAVELWYLVNPSSGSNTISIPNTDTNGIVPIASAWTGVDTSDPLDTSGSSFLGDPPGGTNPSVTITTAAANELVIDAMSDGENSGVPIAHSHTLIFSQANAGWNSNAQYTTAQSPAGNITLDWTLAGTDDWAMIVAAFNPSGAPPPSRRVMLIH